MNLTPLAEAYLAKGLKIRNVVYSDIDELYGLYESVYRNKWLGKTIGNGHTVTEGDVDYVTARLNPQGKRYSDRQYKKTWEPVIDKNLSPKNAQGWVRCVENADGDIVAYASVGRLPCGAAEIEDFYAVPEREGGKGAGIVLYHDIQNLVRSKGGSDIYVKAFPTDKLVKSYELAGFQPHIDSMPKGMLEWGEGPIKPVLMKASLKREIASTTPMAEKPLNQIAAASLSKQPGQVVASTRPVVHTRVASSATPTTIAK